MAPAIASLWEDNAGASGTYNLSGGSLLGAIHIIGASGSGTFIQTGGTNTVSVNSAVGYSCRRQRHLSP